MKNFNVIVLGKNNRAFILYETNNLEDAKKICKEESRKEINYLMPVYVIEVGNGNIVHTEIFKIDILRQSRYYNDVYQWLADKKEDFYINKGNKILIRDRYR